MRIRITYYIEDGYANVHGSPHYLRIDSEDVEDMSDEDLETFIEDEIRRDMEQKFHPVFEIEDIKEEIREALEEEAEEAT